jgi:hypothetical protein
MRLSLAIGTAALVAASALAHAQAPDANKPPRRFDCSQAKDPKACEERLAKAQAVRKACEGKQGDERRECVRREACAQAADPAKCEAQARERLAKREKAREACKGKQGDEHRACLREQFGAKGSS